MAEITPGTQFIGMAPGLDLKERRSASNNSKTEVYTLEDIQETVLDLSTPPSDGDVLTYDAGASAPVWSAPSGGGSEYTETIVNISSAEILDLSTTAKNALPALSGSDKRAIDKICIKFNANTIPYTVIGTDLQNHFLLSLNGTVATALPVSFTQGNLYVELRNSIYFPSPIPIDGTPYDHEYNLAPFGDGSLSFQYIGIDSNGDIVNDLSIEDGNGFFEIKIYHKTITFGA
jgi:hypothetical protein